MQAQTAREEATVPTSSGSLVLEGAARGASLPAGSVRETARGACRGCLGRNGWGAKGASCGLMALPNSSLRAAVGPVWGVESGSALPLAPHCALTLQAPHIPPTLAGAPGCWCGLPRPPLLQDGCKRVLL